jgi:hypothetical protein
MKYPEIKLKDGQLHIDDLVIDTAVIYAMVNEAPRVLWQFRKVDGQIVAIPYSEEHVIWVDKHPDGEL